VKPGPLAPLWLPVAVAALVLASCSSAPKHPGFYREDGPPEHVPPDLLATPDAIPREEPLNPYANRPYAALGRNYVPDTSDAPFRQRGIASWYGREFQGNRTASGERYDMFAMTAAHPTLPIPSYARVTRVDDGRSVIVRVNDRGPFVRDRIIDLSYAAAVRLGLAAPGSGEVIVERVVPGRLARAAPLAPPQVAAAPVAPPQVAAASMEVEAPAAVALAVVPPGSQSVSSALASGQPAVSAGARTAPDDPPQPPPAGGTRWSVQVGAFKVAMNAEALRDRLALLLSSPEAAGLPAQLRAPRVERQAGLSRVLIGEAAQRGEALRWSRLLEQFLARPTVLFAR
jgi:rare lipoprotein A